MLSDVELRKYYHRHIAIIPFNLENVENGIIHVTASNIAYSLKNAQDAKKIVEGNKNHSINTGNIVSNGKIIIKPGDTALIYTKESICLSRKLAGTCHNRVSMAAKGLENPGTPLLPGSSARLLIPIYNQSVEECTISVGEKIAVIMLHKLGRKASKKSTDRTKERSRTDSHIGLLKELGVEMTTEEAESIKEGQYDLKKANEEMKKDQAYTAYRNENLKKLFSQLCSPKAIIAYIIIIALSALIMPDGVIARVGLFVMILALIVAVASLLISLKNKSR